ncbi:MAG: GntR family transcriptional regulator [Lachnospiraceae bacterium]|jgi:GntR family transcriptional regulator|nr:GntR family transcriptional regulator [Lachnospiraceae bacterium]
MVKNSIVPLYQQLSDEIKAQINGGKLKAGDRLMTEAELSQQYEVSRITVRKAIELLVDEGYVMRKQGIGTFIAEKKLRRVVDSENLVLSFSEMSQMNGQEPSSDLLSVEWITPGASIIHHLHVDEEEKVLKIVRLRKNDGIPVMVETNYYPQQMDFLLQANLTGSTYEIFREHGLIPSHGNRTVQICYATSEEAQYLNVEANQPLLLQTESVTDQNGKVLHYSKVVINSQLYRLTIIT